MIHSSSVCNFYRSQIEAGKYCCDMEKAQKHIVKKLLEGTHFLVRWILRMFYW